MRRFSLLVSLVLTFVFALAGSGWGQTFTTLHNFYGPEGQNSFAILTQGRDGALYGTASAGGASGMGVVFRIDAAGTYRVLHSFTGPEGDSPQGGLTLGTDGNFYGTTYYGGTQKSGVIYKMTPGGQVTVLINLGSAVGAYYPQGPPIIGTDGYFYGNTYGGPLANGQFYKLDKTLSTLTVLYSATNPTPVPVQGSDGSFYIASYNGGSYGYGNVERITSTGGYNGSYSFNSPQGAFMEGLSLGTDGNVYGVALEGGTGNSGGSLFRFDKSFNLSILHDYNTTATDGSTPAGSPLAGSDGRLYGTTFFGGTYGDGIIYSYAPDGTLTNLYSFNNGISGTTTPFGQPFQNTNGIFYGTTYYGGQRHALGQIYSLDVGLKPFIALVTNIGKVGSTVEILGQGFTGTTAVNFTGAAANFTVVNDTYLTAIVPAGATTGKVEATTPGRILTSNRDFIVKK